MKEKPILYSTPMVRAILRDIDPKQQTRRLIKGLAEGFDWSLLGFDKETGIADFENQYGHIVDIKCPYGKPKDQLWVRETFHATHTADIPECRKYYRADCDVLDEEMLSVKWTPSIHMFRWASRIDLRIKNIRVERLQDISEEDAKAEGLLYHELFEKWGYKESSGKWRGYKSPVDAFKHLWTSINGPESWEANPFVWVVDFERIQPDSKQEAA